MSGYAKLMKDTVTKKRAVGFELVDNLHYCSMISSWPLSQYKKDPSAFTIYCIIGASNFEKPCATLVLS